LEPETIFLDTKISSLLGEANLSSAKDHQWSIKTSSFGSDVYVLLTGSQNQPFVWVIDPNDRNDGESRSIVDHKDAIVEIIEHVRLRKGSRVQRRVKETWVLNLLD
jgi:hypothetical protein